MRFQPKYRRVASLKVFAAVLLISMGRFCLLRAEQPRSGQTMIRSLPAGITLSQTRVGDIIQDGKGFLWIATQYGLNRYDGFRVRQFFHDPGNARSVGCSYIHGLFKD